MHTQKLQAELGSILPADFDREVVIFTEKLDVLDLLESTSKSSRVIAAQLASLPSGALLGWRPPRRGWAIWVPSVEIDHIDFEFCLRLDDWSCVPLTHYLDRRFEQPIADESPEPVTYYSAEEIIAAKKLTTIGSEDLLTTLASVLAGVSKDVVDQLAAACVFLLAPKNEIAFVPAKRLHGKSILLLPTDFLEWEEDKQAEVILLLGATPRMTRGS